MNVFLELLKEHKLPIPTTEFKFCKDRKWKFDYAFEKKKVAVEQEGGIWTSGRHTRGSGFMRDLEKYNKAVLLGWRVLRYSPEQMMDEAIRDLKEIGV